MFWRKRCRHWDRQCGSNSANRWPNCALRIALLDELWLYPALPITVRHQTWRPNDTILWDNRRVLHHRDDFDNKTRRLMKRCQILARASSD
ncbi:MAG: hypothetical protein CMQ44_01120 [Gammaproteobacteria bacterium]|nr:hypothetical protein [Gammaproteobacteria bacterium]